MQIVHVYCYLDAAYVSARKMCIARFFVHRRASRFRERSRVVHSALVWRRPATHRERASANLRLRARAAQCGFFEVEEVRGGALEWKHAPSSPSPIAVAV